MVCSTCGIKGHNKKTCNEILINNKIDKIVISKNIKGMLNNIEALKGKPKKIEECSHLFNYMLFHKWFLINHKQFYNTVLSKCKDLRDTDGNDFPKIDNYINTFSKLIKPIKTDNCPICYDTLGKVNICTTICGHTFCMICMVKYLRTNSTCPLCKDPMIYN